MKKKLSKDITSSQLGTKLNDNPTLQLTEITCGDDEKGEWRITNTGKVISEYANDKLAKQVGETRAQVSRYIRLTNLIPKIFYTILFKVFINI